MQVQGPNGLIVTVADGVGQALLVNDGFREVSETPKARPKTKK